MPPPPRRGIKRWCCLTSGCCLSPTSGLSREQRGLGRPNFGTEVAHVARGLPLVKGQGHQAALFTAVLARQATAAVDVGTCWPWETGATLPSARRRKELQRPRGEERGGAYRGGRRSTACYSSIFKGGNELPGLSCCIVFLSSLKLSPGKFWSDVSCDWTILQLFYKKKDHFKREEKHKHRDFFLATPGAY